MAGTAGGITSRALSQFEAEGERPPYEPAKRPSWDCSRTSQSWLRLRLPRYAERSLDLGHQRVLPAGLSEFGEIFHHRLGPGLLVGEQIGLVRFVYGASLCTSIEIHQR